MSNIVSALTAESVILHASPNGEVRKVEGMARIFEKMAASLPQNAAATAAMDALKGSMSDEAMGSQLSQSFAQLPDQPVKRGDTWTRQIDLSNPIIGKGTTAMTFTLDAVESSSASTIARVSVKTATRQSAAQTSAALPVTIRLDDSSGEGEQLFDATRGRLLRSTLRVTTPMTMETSVPNGGKLSLRTISNATVTTELLER